MIKQMERYARVDSSIISLGQGIPDAPAAQTIHQEVINALRRSNGIDRYSDPQGLPVLRQRICDKLLQSNMQYAEDEIVVTTGAIEALSATLLTFVTSQKTEVIVPTPTYSAYERAIKCAKGVPVAVQLREEQNWQLDIADVEAAISPKTAAILLIIDEVYGNMIFDNEKLYSPCTNQTFKKTIVRIVSFSKDFNLTGWRIGFLHSDQEIVRQIVPIHDTLVNCAPVVSQYAAMAALDIYDTVIRQNHSSYWRRRDIMQRYLERMPDWFESLSPAGGYFLFPRLLRCSDASQFCHDLLRMAGVIAIPGEDFGKGGEGHIRLCFGRSEADIHAGMQKLEQYVRRQESGYAERPRVTSATR